MLLTLPFSFVITNNKQLRVYIIVSFGNLNNKMAFEFFGEFLNFFKIVHIEYFCIVFVCFKPLFPIILELRSLV